MQQNQLTTKDAVQNLQNLINAGLRAGLFSEPPAVRAVQDSLDLLTQVAAEFEQVMNQKAMTKVSLPPFNGEKKMEGELAEQ